MRCLFLLFWGLFILNCSKKESENHNVKIHKQDSTNFGSETEKISGKYVLFLRPYEKKFDSLKDEPGVYEVDSDFGFAISSTLDSLNSNLKYKNIQNNISTKRYITIENCKNCPLKIDRDSILYGIILISPNKELQIINGIGTLSYLPIIDKYFNEKN